MSDPIVLYRGEKRKLSIDLTTSGLSAAGFTGSPTVTAQSVRGEVDHSVGASTPLLATSPAAPAMASGKAEFFTVLIPLDFPVGRYRITGACAHSSGETPADPTLIVIVQ